MGFFGGDSKTTVITTDKSISQGQGGVAISGDGNTYNVIDGGAFGLAQEVVNNSHNLSLRLGLGAFDLSRSSSRDMLDLSRFTSSQSNSLARSVLDKSFDFAKGAQSAVTSTTRRLNDAISGIERNLNPDPQLIKLGAIAVAGTLLFSAIGAWRR